MSEVKTYKEMMAKTGCRIIGFVRSINEYVQKDTGKKFYSVDVDIREVRLPVNIKLREGYPIESIPEGELCQFNCQFRPSFGGKGLEVVAV